MRSIFAFVFASTLVLQVAVGSAQSASQLVNTHSLGNSNIRNVTFKLLAVEDCLGNVTMQSAQLLISSLLSFSNWQNSTVSAGFQYFSYIHLLSAISPAYIDESSQPFYRGRATRENLLNEISNFLTEKPPFEEAALSVRIFFFAGNTRRIVTHGNSSYCLALDQSVYDWELDQVLPTDSTPTLVILDACYSGGFVTKLAVAGRSILTACSPVETVAASLRDENHNYCSLLTGAESALYSNGTRFGPLGITGGIKTAPDLNRDGWRSACEIFKFASQTVRWYNSNRTDSDNGRTYTLNPWAYFGVVGGEISLVRHNSSTPFPYNGKVFPFPLFSPDPFRFESETFQFRMYRYSPSNMGFSKAKGPETPDLAWSIFLSDPVTSSASVADGIVFVGTAGGTLYAAELTTGNIIWNFSAGSPISSSPAIEGGIVVFGTEEPGRIYALNEHTGTIRWIYEVSAGSPVLSSPTIKDGKVFIASSDGYLRVFTLFEGFLVWESYMNSNIGSSPAVSDGAVFVAGNDVCAFDELTGALIWRFITSWPVFSSPAVYNGVVYVGTGNDDTVYALNASTGEPLWSRRCNGWFSSPSIDYLKNFVVLANRDGRVYCFDKKTGWLNWAFITEGPNHLSSPTISANGFVYIGSLDNNTYCIGEDTGQKIWSYTTGGPITSSPTIIDEHVIIGSQDGYLYCFGPPFETHDVSILDAATSSETLKLGDPVEISYSVRNFGNTLETVTVTCAYNKSNVWGSPEYLEPTAFNLEVITIEQGGDFNNTYVWNTSDVQPGKYSIIVQANLASDEAEASNNIFMDGSLLLVMISDLDVNGAIDIVDIAITAKAYGSRPGDDRWNQEADLDNNRVIDIVDIATVAKDFGKIYF